MSHDCQVTHLDDPELDELGGEANELVRINVGVLCSLVPVGNNQLADQWNKPSEK